jgi:sugar phosphate isomerase/epimerase
MEREIFVHLPWNQVEGRMEALAEEGVGAEIYLPAPVLEEVPLSTWERLASLLEKNQLPCTVHGPFLDLNPGSGDEIIRKASLDRYSRAFTVARVLRPLQMVLHSGYNRWHYGDREDRTRWLEQSRKSWEWALEETAAQGLLLVVENVFEHRPKILGDLLRQLDTKRLRFCFDIGHWRLFSESSVSDWLTELGPFLVEVHLHDNRGQNDDHLALGEGSIDFTPLFQYLAHREAAPLLTIEAFDERRVRASLQALRLLGREKEKRE